MRKYRFTYMEDGKEVEKIIESEHGTDKIAVLVDEFDHSKGEESTVDIKKLEAKFGKVYSHTSTVCTLSNISTVKRVTFYYIPAIAIDKKEYKTVDSFNNEYELEGIVEIKFQLGEDCCFAYVDVKSKNCSTFDIIDFALEKIYQNPSKYIPGASKCDEEGIVFLPFLNEGGWDNTFEVYDWEEDIKDFISGFRFVEEVKTDAKTN